MTSSENEKHVKFSLKTCINVNNLLKLTNNVKNSEMFGNYKNVENFACKFEKDVSLIELATRSLI